MALGVLYQPLHWSRICTSLHLPPPQVRSSTASFENPKATPDRLPWRNPQHWCLYSFDHGHQLRWKYVQLGSCTGNGTLGRRRCSADPIHPPAGLHDRYDGLGANLPSSVFASPYNVDFVCVDVRCSNMRVCKFIRLGILSMKSLMIGCRCLRITFPCISSLSVATLP